MRTLILLASLLGLSPSLNADQNTVEALHICRLEAFDFPSYFNAADRLEADLLQGLWVVKDRNAQGDVYQFHPYGMVDIISTEANGQLSIETLMWKVEQRLGKVALVLTDSRFTQQIITMEATCEGLNAFDMDSLHDLALVLKPSISGSDWKRMKSCIFGEWTSVSFPSDLAKSVGCKPDPRSGISSMQFQFREDGSYTRVCETPSARLEENGFYEITPDGQYVIFYASGPSVNPAETYHASVVRIQHLSVGELVFEQPVHAFGYEGIQHTAVRSVAYMH